MKRKKIGLLTMPLIDNYGGIIQIAALYHFLETEGYTPYLIDKRYNLAKWKVIIKNALEYNPLYKIYDFNSYTKRRLYLKQINTFIDSFFRNKTNAIYNNRDLFNETRKLNAIIVGSDQVWRYNYVKNDYENYFLDFVDKGVNKLSYAASFGVDEWEGSMETALKVSEFLSDFNAISVREDSGIDLCESVFNINNAEHVLDPTFLPETSFYDNLILTENHTEKIELFSYVLDKSTNKEKYIRNIGKTLNLKTNSIYLENDFKNEELKPSISKWLYNFKNAKYIVTDSFHGMVFSILFNKQFIALGNKERGLTRFASLLKLLGLEDRLITNIADKAITNSLLSTQIDYETVNKKMEFLKEKSIRFLNEHLNF